MIPGDVTAGPHHDCKALDYPNQFAALHMCCRTMQRATTAFPAKLKLPLHVMFFVVGQVAHARPTGECELSGASYVSSRLH